MRETYPWDRPLGARVVGDGLVEVRVWASGEDRRVTVRIARAEHELADEGLGMRSAVVAGRPGDDYWLTLDGRRYPDPASRWQPRGLRGASRVVDHQGFSWTDDAFVPAPLRAAVLYELHVGTFTPQGTFDAAIPHLAELRSLGVTHVELMPVAEFPGRHGWGYDGVYLSAAHSAYGGPEALQRLVDAAHGTGLGVILDVVYNHVGASGTKALESFGSYFTSKYDTFWGRAINYDDAGCDPVRAWVLQSAEGWVRDFHLDGLRLDAVHAMYDASPEHVLAQIAERVHRARPGAVVIAESGLNDPKVMRPRRRGGYGHDAAWADDFHHALRALLTGERGGWYVEFGQVAQLAKAFRRPHVHDGGWSTFRHRRFGAPAADRPVEQFVVFCQNHDQVGNRALGDRLPASARPLAAFATLLSPFVPMLFMGEEHGERAPFQFFSDHIDKRIATATRDGRRREFAPFAEFAGEELPDPQDPATFAASKLTRRGSAKLRTLYRELLAARSALPHGDVDDVAFDEERRWLIVRRGPYTLVMNFAARPQEIPVTAAEVVVATHGVTSGGEALRLPARAGAMVR
ncbi:MAG: malto-oligosyltrehalose trehalohydrolase [Actinomycetota bacterium]|nr:malto-oligosyltrehalose trehalohydrolase [Actinomycetota bacterium]